MGEIKKEGGGEKEKEWMGGGGEGERWTVEKGRTRLARPANVQDSA